MIRTVYKQRVETMIRMEDCSDEELRDELVQRGYVVYEGKDVRQCITKLERLQENLLGRLNKIKKG